ncbi:MAG: hypothetical protein RIR51_636, partial [Bacteroidota bacterium]
FLEKYPESAYLKETEKLYSNAIDRVVEIAKVEAEEDQRKKEAAKLQGASKVIGSEN